MLQTLYGLDDIKPSTPSLDNHDVGSERRRPGAVAINLR
jgi:hypothetical protein